MTFDLYYVKVFHVCCENYALNCESLVPLNKSQYNVIG